MIWPLFFAVLVFVLVFGWLAWRVARRRDTKPSNSLPVASDGSRFWGRRNAELTEGKVVTKGSREKAAEALAEAEDVNSLQIALATNEALVSVQTQMLQSQSREIDQLKAEVVKTRERAELAEASVAKVDAETLAALKSIVEAASKPTDAVTEAIAEATRRNAHYLGGTTVTGGGVPLTGTGEFTWSNKSSPLLRPLIHVQGSGEAQATLGGGGSLQGGGVFLTGGGQQPVWSVSADSTFYMSDGTAT